MEGTWDLSALYSGFDDPAYMRDMDALQSWAQDYCRQVDVLRTAGGGMCAADLADLLVREEGMWVVAADLHKFTELRREVDNGDSRAADCMELLKKHCGAVAGHTAQVRRWIAALPLSQSDYDAHPILADYRFYLEQARQEGAHLLDSETELLLAKMQACAGDAWSNLRGYLTSFAQEPLDGKPLTLTQLRSLAGSDDAATRKAAYEAELRCSQSIAGGVCFALNSIKEQMNLMVALRGYESILDLTLRQSRMQAQTLDAMWSAIRQALPKFHAYLRRKAALLGHPGGLPWYDLSAGLGSEGQTFTLEEARAFLVQHLGAFAPDLGDLVDRAFRERWIDFYPRPGKTGGAFCRNLTNQKQSRVLTNFNGTLDGVTTIAHELGHAYHGQQIQTHRPLNRTYTMPVAETASNFNETLVMSAAIAQSQGAQRLALLESRLQDYTQTICDIYSRFLFERDVFRERQAGFLFPERLCTLMTEAQKQAYGDGLDPNCLHPYMWVNKVHYYYTSLSFYNFPYAFGTLFANGLYARYQAEGAPFVARYRNMLEATTVCTVEQAAALAGVDVTGTNFWDESLALITAQIDEFLALSAPLLPPNATS